MTHALAPGNRCGNRFSSELLSEDALLVPFWACELCTCGEPWRCMGAKAAGLAAGTAGLYGMGRPACRHMNLDLNLGSHHHLRPILI